MINCVDFYPDPNVIGAAVCRILEATSAAAARRQHGVELYNMLHEKVRRRARIVGMLSRVCCDPENRPAVLAWRLHGRNCLGTRGVPRMAHAGALNAEFA